MYSQEVELRGHLIDSMILSKVFDIIMDKRGEFEVLEFSIGKRKYEHSHVRLLVKADTKEELDDILRELYRMGAVPSGLGEARLVAAPEDGVPPDGFYVTTNHPTEVYVNGRWTQVENISAYKIVVYDPENLRAYCKPAWSVRKGELVVVGEEGVKVSPPERPREGVGVFEFMSRLAPRVASPSLILGLAEEMQEIKDRGGKIVLVAGSVVVHTGVADSLASIIHKGFVDALIAGNGLLLHDVEYRLFGTSIGASVKKDAKPGYGNHVRAAVEIRKNGGLKGMVDKGILREGIAYEAIMHGVELLVLAGPEDEYPIPEAVTDVLEAQGLVSEAVSDADLVLVLASSAAAPVVLNSLRSTVKLALVDINPAATLRMMGREIAESVGIISDVSSFLPVLDSSLPELPGRGH